MTSLIYIPVGEVDGRGVEGFADGHDFLTLLVSHLYSFQEMVGYPFQRLFWPRLAGQDRGYKELTGDLFNQQIFDE